jgi:carbamoyltransferase
MLLVAPVRAEKRVGEGGVSAGAARGFERLKAQRSVIPAVTHVDYSARVQTVDTVRAPRLYAILKAFEAQTGCPVMINTSFNVRGEPIVCTPADAYRCFMATDMDALVIENFVMLKERQPTSGTADRERYLAEFALD